MEREENGMENEVKLTKLAKCAGCGAKVGAGTLARLLEADAIPVNSCHHQGIDVLAPELEAMALAEDGLVEAVYAPGKTFVWAVQWHPEFSCAVDENSKKIFRGFVLAAQGGDRA